MIENSRKWSPGRDGEDCGRLCSRVVLEHGRVRIQGSGVLKSTRAYLSVLVVGRDPHEDTWSPGSEKQKEEQIVY